MSSAKITREGVFAEGRRQDYGEKEKRAMHLKPGCQAKVICKFGQ